MNKNLILLYRQHLHKLNNEIGSIRVNVQEIFLERQELLENDSFLAECLKDIQLAAEEVMALKDQFREYLETPDVEAHVSVHEYVTKAVENITIPESINISINVSKDLPQIIADHGLIEVLHNLIRNAIQAMPNGGVISIEASANKERKHIEIKITDTGTGIPENITDKLFNIGVSTKAEKGLGFGLYWCKNYLKNIGGDISLHWTELSKGSCFLISLPFV